MKSHSVSYSATELQTEPKEATFMALQPTADAKAGEKSQPLSRSLSLSPSFASLPSSSSSNSSSSSSSSSSLQTNKTPSSTTYNSKHTQSPLLSLIASSHSLHICISQLGARLYDSVIPVKREENISSLSSSLSLSFASSSSSSSSSSSPSSSLSTTKAKINSSSSPSSSPPPSPSLPSFTSIIASDSSLSLAIDGDFAVSVANESEDQFQIPLQHTICGGECVCGKREGADSGCGCGCGCECKCKC